MLGSAVAEEEILAAHGFAFHYFGNVVAKGAYGVAAQLHPKFRRARDATRFC